jgi:drug/metabolite transporter (DMT)-like permease
MIKLFRDFKVIQAITFVLLGFIIYAVMDAIVKSLSREFPLVEILLFNALFALIPILYLSHRLDKHKSLRTKNLKLQTLRGFVMFVATFCAFYGYSRLPLADAYAITFSVPFFVIILSTVLLGETAGVRRWIAVLLGFLGVMFVVKPDHGIFNYASLGPLGAAIGIATGIIIVRHLGKTESSSSIAFYSNLVITLCAVIAIAASSIFFGITSYVKPTTEEFLLLAASGLLNGIADVFMFNAYKKATAPVLAPYQYTQIIWGMLVGYLVFGDVPDTDLIIGSSIVVASGLYLIYHDVRLEKKGKKATHQAEIMLAENR